jgi:hypothetical protein
MILLNAARDVLRGARRRLGDVAEPGETWAEAQERWRARMARREAQHGILAKLRPTPGKKSAPAWCRRGWWFLALMLGVGVWIGLMVSGHAQWGPVAFGYALLLALFGAGGDDP